MILYMYMLYDIHTFIEFYPTEDALEQHVLRAQYQTSIWCQSHLPHPQLDDPTDHGWKKGPDDQLQCTMYRKDCAPIELRDVTHLYCKDKGCHIPGKCPCKMAGLPCIEACNCKDCSNNPPTLSGDSDSDSDDDD